MIFTLLLSGELTVAMKGKTITVSNQQESWIRSQIRSCEIGDNIEYIRELTREGRLEKQTLADLRQALALGEASGDPVPLDMGGIGVSARRKPAP